MELKMKKLIISSIALSLTLTQLALAESSLTIEGAGAGDPGDRGDGWSMMDESVKIPELPVDGLKQYAGRYLSAVYISGKPNSLGFGEIIVNKVMMDPVSEQIGAAGKVIFPAVEVQRLGSRSCNHVLLVISDQALKASDFDAGTPGFILKRSISVEHLQALKESTSAAVGFRDL